MGREDLCEAWRVTCRGGRRAAWLRRPLLPAGNICTLSSDVATLLYTRVFASLPHGYMRCSLSTFLSRTVLTSFCFFSGPQALLRGWQPLAEPSRGLPEVRTWRTLLQADSAAAGGGVLAGGADGEDADGGGGAAAAAAAAAEDPYTLLVWEVVLPPVRSAVLNGWEPRDPEPLLGWLEVGVGQGRSMERHGVEGSTLLDRAYSIWSPWCAAIARTRACRCSAVTFAFFLLLLSLLFQAWEPLLPAPVLGHVLEMLVLPKLRTAVGDWEPRRETVPIHAWLFPWLPYLGQVRRRCGTHGCSINTRVYSRRRADPCCCQMQACGVGLVYQIGDTGSLARPCTFHPIAVYSPFPPLPPSPQALDELYPSIRHKLDVALAAWHPSDGSALMLLAPWQRVWEAREWDAFMAKVRGEAEVWRA